jgi:transcription-repair coupling factor (superfamily II helicase)
MNLDVLLQRYENSPRIFSITDRLSFSKPQQIHLQNLQGSASQFVFSAIFNHPHTKGFNHLVILNDAESAAYFHNTVENITRALNLYYFPSSFKNRKNFKLLNSSHIMLRTEALTKFSTQNEYGRTGAMITYADALFEKVVLREKLSDNIIYIKAGDTIDVQGIMEKFVAQGFTRNDFVYEPGQFALRGGILDIYSFGNEKPYRIELFGNDVDSIRIFDAETQLSERRVLQVSIIPNVETRFETENKVSLFDFLPDHTIVWIQDWDYVKEVVEQQLEDVGLFMEREKEQELVYSKMSEPEKKRFDKEQGEEPVEGKINISGNDFIDVSAIEKSIRQKHIVEFGNKSLFKNEPDSFFSTAFSTSVQPVFNRQFDLLIKDLLLRKKENNEIFIFSDQVKQLERLRSIFEDLPAGKEGKPDLSFIPVPISIHEGFTDTDLNLVCYTDHQIFQRYHKYKVKQAYNKNKAITLRSLRELQPGDYVTHIDHGVGIYSGLQKMEVNGRMQEAVRLVYKDTDILYVNINSLHKISKYTGKEGSIPKINKLGTDTWSKLKEKTKVKVKEIAFDLIQLYAKRKSLTGFEHQPDNYMSTELEASFIYEDTPDQARAIADVKKDMESSSPMDRLVCGDVGFGKTEVAIRAAFKTCIDGKQAAVLVPTTILAFQHYKTFQERLKDFPVTVDFINRFKSAKQKKETLQKLAEGKIDILIGTHGLLGKDTKFKDLGLMIVDEEQKFGVAHKEKLKTLRSTVDSLTLTATPIPRTLQFSLMGARDLSIINTPPPNRQPIQTEIKIFNEDFIRDAIYFETERGGQVFFIHNRVIGLAEMAALINGLCPDLSIGYAHGQLEGDELEERILDFVDRKYDVLVCTNIVESGVDIPNVNTILVNNAHQFGLSDLHQLRGRVGRSNKKAFCYLLAPPLSTLPNDSKKRLQTLEQHSDLGSGFQIAMRDLDIRGAGNMLGGEQSGFMAEIGFEMYHKILDEAVRELKRSKFKELFKDEIQIQDSEIKDCTIDTDLEILIPDTYVENITERLSLYSRLDNCDNEADLVAFQQELNDRFGKPPGPVLDLFTTVRCRKTGIALGFEKMVLKENTLKCFFTNKPDSQYFESETFKKILEFLNQGTNKARLKQTGKNFLLIVDDIKTMARLQQELAKYEKFVFVKKEPSLLN